MMNWMQEVIQAKSELSSMILPWPEVSAVGCAHVLVEDGKRVPGALVILDSWKNEDCLASLKESVQGILGKIAFQIYNPKPGLRDALCEPYSALTDFRPEFRDQQYRDCEGIVDPDYENPTGPARPGDRLLVLAATNDTYGQSTFGLAARRIDDKRVVLFTAGHALEYSNFPNETKVFLATSPRPTYLGRVGGLTHRGTPPYQYMDAGYVIADRDGLVTHLYGRQQIEITGIVQEVRECDIVKKSSFRTGDTGFPPRNHCYVLATNADIIVPISEYDYTSGIFRDVLRHFRNGVIVASGDYNAGECIQCKGDSGAVWLTDDNRAALLGFASTKDSKLAYCHLLKPALDFFSLEAINSNGAVPVSEFRPLPRSGIFHTGMCFDYR